MGGGPSIPRRPPGLPPSPHPPPTQQIVYFRTNQPSFSLTTPPSLPPARPPPQTIPANRHGNHLPTTRPPSAAGGGTPPPSLDVQRTSIIRNPVNLKKKTLLLTKDTNLNHLYYLSFQFDAADPAHLFVYFATKEVIIHDHQPTFQCPPGKACPPRFVKKGLGQQYKSTPAEALNLLEHKIEDLQYKDKSDIYPIVIELKCVAGGNVQSQITYSSLVPKKTTNTGEDQRGWGIETLKQKIQYGEKSFQVQEIYGIDRYNTGEGNPYDDDFLSGRECVICLAEERNTAVLPCRHMCLCSACANIMRLQSNKCPICRQNASTLLQIAVSDRDAG